jgi:ribosomal protein S18 acetylase RimI-like enzyme
MATRKECQPADAAPLNGAHGVRRSKILTDAADSELAHAVQENLFELFRAMTALPGSELAETAELSRHFAPATNPMFQGVWRARLDEARVETAITESLDWFKARRAAFVFWWIGSDCTPSDLVTRLEARGFDAHVAGEPGMGAEIGALVPVAAPDGFTSVHATSRKALEDWRDVFCSAFGAPLWAGQAWVETTLAAGGADAPWQMHVGYHGATPVATNILFLGAGVAGLYGVATIPQARRRGYGRAITVAPLSEAVERGYRYTVLFSSQQGYPVYRRLGFRELDCRIGRYLWINTDAEPC